MTALVAKLRNAAGALAFLGLTLVSYSALAQQPNSVDPAASAVHEDQLLSFPFTLGVILIFLMWIAGNIPNRVDLQWLRRGGGMVAHDPAGLPLQRRPELYGHDGHRRRVRGNG